LYQQGAVVGACFTGYGHEAIAVGAAYTLGPQDVASTLHRDLGARLVLGMPIGYYFANFLGRIGSPTRGREGNLHIGGLGPRILLPIDDRMAGYGMASCSIDGNDVLAVHDAARRAVDRARAGEGPSFLECRTMRMRGHSEADDASYVPKALLDEWRPRDPVKRFEDHL